MSIVTDYSNCERCKVENGRMYDFNCNTGEESDNCLVCGEQKMFNFSERKKYTSV